MDKRRRRGWYLVSTASICVASLLVGWVYAHGAEGVGVGIAVTGFVFLFGPHLYYHTTDPDRTPWRWPVDP